MAKFVSRWAGKNAKHYNSKEYRTNLKIILERDMGHCVRCWHIHKWIKTDIECDHFIAISADEEHPDHSVSNLWLLCRSCHALKTAQESHHKFNKKKPFGDSDRDADGWSINIDWQKIIEGRNKGLPML